MAKIIASHVNFSGKINGLAFEPHTEPGTWISVEDISEHPAGQHLLKIPGYTLHAPEEEDLYKAPEEEKPVKVVGKRAAKAAVQEGVASTPASD